MANLLDTPLAIYGVNPEVDKFSGQTIYGDEVMKTPKGYAEGGMIEEGNGMESEVPIGALPKEVADDVPINASEGEYVLPADVVRYLGLEYIEKLVERAKNGLQENAAKGRIGGSETPPAALSEAPVPGAPGMATGGMVKDNYTGVRQYQDASGNVIQIAFSNGEPLQPIPQGARMVSQAAGVDVPDVGATSPQPVKRQGNSSEAQNLSSPLAGSPTDWTAKDFGNFARGQNSVGERVGQNLVGVTLGPIGALASKARSRYLKNTVPDLLQKTIATGVDPAGNTLSPEQIADLTEVQKQVTANFASKNNPTNKRVDAAFAGFGALTNPAGPIAGLASAAVQAGMGAVADKVADTVEGAVKSVKEKNAKLAKETAKATEAQTKAAATDSSKSTKDSDSKGESAARANTSTEPDKEDDTKSGYRKGGLVTRKSEKSLKMAKGGLVKRKC